MFLFRKRTLSCWKIGKLSRIPWQVCGKRTPRFNSRVLKNDQSLLQKCFQATRTYTPNSHDVCFRFVITRLRKSIVRIMHFISCTLNHDNDYSQHLSICSKSCRGCIAIRNWRSLKSALWSHWLRINQDCVSPQIRIRRISEWLKLSDFLA